jgi:hypothetical protein
MSIYKRFAGNVVFQTVGNTDTVTFQGLTANTATVIIDGNLSVSGNATLSGNISGDKIFNGTTSIEIPVASGNANISIGGTSNVAVVANTGVYVNGLISASGNITGANLVTTGNTTLSNLIISNGSQFLNFTSTAGVDPVIRFTDANTTGGTAGNVGTIQWYTNDATGAGPRVTAAIRAVYSDTNGNANILIQTGSTTTPTTRIAVIGATGNVGIANTAPLHALAVTGTMYGSSTFTAVGNVSGGNITTAGQVSATANITGGNVITSGLATVTGNITGGNVISLGAVSAGAAGITATGNVRGGNVNSDGTVSATGSVTAVGNIIAGTNLSASGNIITTQEVQTGNINVSGASYGTGIGVENIVWQSTSNVIVPTALSNIGNLQFSFLGGRSYKFESVVYIIPDGASNPTNYSVYFDAGSCTYTVEAQASATGAWVVSTSNVSDALSTNVSTTGTTPRALRISGTIYSATAANVSIKAATAAANLNVLSGSYLTYTRIS